MVFTSKKSQHWWVLSARKPQGTWQELEHSLSIELLRHRIDCYALVMKYLDPIAHFSSKTRVSENIELTDNLHKWWSQEKGGLLMSNNSRPLYNRLSNKLTGASVSALKEPDPRDDYISQDAAGEVVDAARDFRTSLLYDVGVKEAPKPNP